MNRNGNGYQETTSDSLQSADLFVTSTLQRKSELVMPIITPRFAPSCDKELLVGLGDIAKKHNTRYISLHNRFGFSSLLKIYIYEN